MKKKTFDLFLFLLFLWLLLMLNFQRFTYEMLIAGIFSSATVAILARYLQLITNESKQLFLSLRFYRHFLRIYSENFYRSLSLIFDLAFGFKSFAPQIKRVAIYKKFRPDLALLIASINMISGLMVIEVEEENILIYAINPDCFADFELLKTAVGLSEINDDDLI